MTDAPVYVPTQRIVPEGTGRVWKVRQSDGTGYVWQHFAQAFIPDKDPSKTGEWGDTLGPFTGEHADYLATKAISRAILEARKPKSPATNLSFKSACVRRVLGELALNLDGVTVLLYRSELGMLTVSIDTGEAQGIDTWPNGAPAIAVCVNEERRELKAEEKWSEAG